MECMPCGNSSFVLLLQAVVLAVHLNQLFLPETKWPEKLVSKVIIKLSGKSEVVICCTAIFYYCFECFVVRTSCRKCTQLLINQTMYFFMYLCKTLEFECDLSAIILCRVFLFEAGHRVLRSLDFLFTSSGKMTCDCYWMIV